ncbi:MAG: hypothetical protein R3E61_07910 [Pseudomonadales bacterium]
MIYQYTQKTITKFDNGNDKLQATNDTKVLSSMLDTLVNRPRASPDLLRRTSILNSIGHNLDIPGATEADRKFSKPITSTNLMTRQQITIWVFLGSSNQGGKALPYLKAKRQGYTNAYYSLGMAYLTQTTLNWL